MTTATAAVQIETSVTIGSKGPVTILYHGVTYVIDANKQIGDRATLRYVCELLKFVLGMRAMFGQVIRVDAEELTRAVEALAQLPGMGLAEVLDTIIPTDIPSTGDIEVKNWPYPAWLTIEQ